MDRRFAKSLPRLELESSLADRIIAMVLESETGDGAWLTALFFIQLTVMLIGRKRLDESEDKAIARLGITYGVLRRLNFSEERVEECLRAIQGVDLEEAYEWVIDLF